MKCTCEGYYITSVDPKLTFFLCVIKIAIENRQILTKVYLYVYFFKNYTKRENMLAIYCFIYFKLFLQMAKKCKVNGKNSSYPILQVINNCKLVHTFNRCIAMFSFYICTYVCTVMCMFTFVFVRGAIFRYLFSRQQQGGLGQQLQ